MYQAQHRRMGWLVGWEVSVGRQSEAANIQGSCSCQSLHTLVTVCKLTHRPSNYVAEAGLEHLVSTS